jgi:hypothetical protein
VYKKTICRHCWKRWIRAVYGVLGTPVYWWGPSAQLKVFLDRWFGQGQVVRFKGRPVILTIPLGGSDASFARHIVGMFEGSFAHLEMDLIATIVAPDVWNAGKVRDHPDVLAAARQAGREAVAFCHPAGAARARRADRAWSHLSPLSRLTDCNDSRQQRRTLPLPALAPRHCAPNRRVLPAPKCHLSQSWHSRVVYLPKSSTYLKRQPPKDGGEHAPGDDTQLGGDLI